MVPDALSKKPMVMFHTQQKKFFEEMSKLNIKVILIQNIGAIDDITSTTT